MKAATLSAPISRILASSQPAAVRPKASRLACSASGDEAGTRALIELEPERLLDVHDARDRQAALRVHAAHAAEGGAGHGRAVVRVVAADEDRALGLAQQVPVAPHHAHHGVVAFRAGAGEEDVLELRRRHLGEQLGQLDGGRRGRLEEAVVEGQRAQLLRRGIDQCLLAVADVDAPQARHRVEDLLAVAVPQIDVLAPGDDARALARECLEVGERMEIVGRVGGLPLLGVAGLRRAAADRGSHDCIHG